MSCAEIILTIISVTVAAFTIFISVCDYKHNKYVAFSEAYHKITMSENYLPILRMLTDPNENRIALWETCVSDPDNARLFENFLAYFNMLTFQFGRMRLFPYAYNEMIIKPMLSDRVLLLLLQLKNEKNDGVYQSLSNYLKKQLRKN